MHESRGRSMAGITASVAFASIRCPGLKESASSVRRPHTQPRVALHSRCLTLREVVDNGCLGRHQAQPDPEVQATSLVCRGGSFIPAETGSGRWMESNL